MTHRERLKALMKECWSDTWELLHPAGWGERVEARAALAAALFRARWTLEIEDERLLRAVNADVRAVRYHVVKSDVLADTMRAVRSETLADAIERGEEEVEDGTH